MEGYFTVVIVRRHASEWRVISGSWGEKSCVIVRRGLLSKHASERRVILEACNNYSRELNDQQRMAQK